MACEKLINETNKEITKKYSFFIDEILMKFEQKIKMTISNQD